MPPANPYDILKVPHDASEDDIEEAYDRLFDRYEPKAHAGDQAAIDMLNTLNEARDTLVDPTRRAALDRSLAKSAQRESKQTAQDERRSPAPNRRQQAANNRPPATIKARPRSRPVSRRSRTIASMMPYFVLVAFLVFGLAIAITYLLNRGPDATVDTGATVATVSGVPIYKADWDVQVTKDKTNALNDPMFSAILNNFQGITGTRALDSLKFDSLDKLINMEVILQQAKKEGLYPTDDQINGMVEQAKASDLAAGQSFDSFLQQHGITADRYRRTVVQNVVYTVMANRHVPATGTADDKTQGWIDWICTTRKNYDVKILVTFIVTNNPSCTSGLPVDLPLPGVDTTPIPEPNATSPAGVTPGANTTSQPTSPKSPTKSVSTASPPSSTKAP